MRSTNPDVIIIRGAPGTGKSQASKCLAAHFQKGARVEVDIIRAMVIFVDWTNQSEHIKMLSLSTSVVMGFLQHGYKPVIVVDTFSGDKLTKFLADIYALDNSLDVRSFALVTAPDVLRVRVANRPNDQFKDIGICLKLNSDMVKRLLPVEQLIDNSALTPEETAEAIRSQCT